MAEDGYLGAEGYLSNAVEVVTTPDAPTDVAVVSATGDGLSLTLSWMKPLGRLSAYDVSAHCERVEGEGGSEKEKEKE